MKGGRRGGAGWRGRRVELIVGAVIVLLAAGYVLRSLARPEPPTFVPSPVAPRPAGDRLVGPVVHTVDASHPVQWRFFSFSSGSVVENPRPFEWDLAFRRFRVVVNGGDGFPGLGGAVALGAVAFDSITRVPENGYVGSRAAADSLNPALERWYDYSFLSHLLMPREGVYAIRTADGRYALLEFVGYYCPGATPGCVTFRYLYQGAGGPDLGGDR